MKHFLPVVILLLTSSAFAGSLPAHYLARYNTVAACMGVKKVPKPPELKFKGTIPCPTSKVMCCLATVKPYPCPGNPSVKCGDSGRYRADEKVIVLPDKCDGAFAHEAIHHILSRTTGSADAQHRSLFFQKCGTPTNTQK